MKAEILKSLFESEWGDQLNYLTMKSNECYQLSAILKSILKEVSTCIDCVADANLQNEQFFLDFLDELNELSVKY